MFVAASVFAACVAAACASGHTTAAIAVASIIIIPVLALYLLLRPSIISTAEDESSRGLPRTEFDARRGLSFPPIVANTWYALGYSEDIVAGAEDPVHIRAIGQSFAVWRTKAGKLVVQSAWCPHQGANVAAGGKIKDDCIACPFHGWQFDQVGTVVKVPAAKDPSNCSSTTGGRKLRAFPSQDWAGMVMVYFHADHDADATPEFELPSHVTKQLEGERWRSHLRVDLGRLALSPIDWVDQVCDHSHFHELHSQVLIPWTTRPMPALVARLLPLNIAHKLTTFMGDSEEWRHKCPSYVSQRSGLPLAVHGPKEYIYFTDDVVVRNGEEDMENTRSSTLEMYIGPAVMCFHVPFTIGNLKVIVCTTPVEGHASVMRVRTHVDSHSPLIWAVGWLVAGVAVSQLAADINIMQHRTRLKKPLRQVNDGPSPGKLNVWLKHFYSESSDKQACGLFVPDW